MLYCFDVAQLKFGTVLCRVGTIICFIIAVMSNESDSSQYGSLVAVPQVSHILVSYCIIWYSTTISGNHLVPYDTTRVYLHTILLFCYHFLMWFGAVLTVFFKYFDTVSYHLDIIWYDFNILLDSFAHFKLFCHMSDTCLVLRTSF